MEPADDVSKRFGVDQARATTVVSAPNTACDLSTTCLVCGEQMVPEHAHYRCAACGWRDSCCDGR